MRLFPKGYPRHLPDWLNLVRLMLGALFVLSVYVHAPAGWLLAVLLTAAVTDWLDGPLARKLGVADESGALMDGLADKMTINAVIISLMCIGSVPIFCGVVLLTRDAIVFTTRFVAARRDIRTSRFGGQINMWLVFIYLLHAIAKPGSAGMSRSDWAVMTSALLTALWTVVSTMRRHKC